MRATILSEVELTAVHSFLRRQIMRLLSGCAMAGLLLAATTVFGEDKPVAEEGKKAPDFKLPGSDGKEYTLKQFAGKQAVVIAWFPKAFTGG
jgi:thioredoxin-dependent peroxiredoxin